MTALAPGRTPRNDRQVVRVLWPNERILLFPKFLQFHCQFTFANFIVGEFLVEGIRGEKGAERRNHLKMRRQSEP